MNILIIEFLRQFRIDGYAIFDLALSFIGMAILAPLLSRLFYKIGFILPKKNWVILTLPLSIVFHILFNQNTLMVQNFFDANGHFGLKILILVLLVFGLRGIKKK